MDNCRDFIGDYDYITFVGDVPLEFLRSYFMKSPIQTAFDELIKNSFHTTLKPLKFKKKGLNFYRNLSEIGHIVQIQKKPI